MNKVSLLSISEKAKKAHQNSISGMIRSYYYSSLVLMFVSLTFSLLGFLVPDTDDHFIDETGLLVIGIASGLIAFILLGKVKRLNT